MLVASAVPLPVDRPPSVRQGHGRVQLDQALLFESAPTFGLWVHEGSFNASGDVHLFCFEGGGRDLKAGLLMFV